jgi:hypothetical protein
MYIIRRSFLTIVLTLGALYGHVCEAQTLIEAVPTGWRMQNYGTVNGLSNVAAFFTGSSCLNGQLLFPSTFTQYDENMFWALILSSKASASEVVVYYSVSGSNCYIQSFATSP